ncbi:MAG: 4'-phosphopantetheinyl transferase superfamily protein [Francisella sp.]
MPISVFFLDFDKYDVNDLKKYLYNKNINLANFNNQQKIVSHFIRYFVLEEFYNISSPVFFYKFGKPYLNNDRFFFNISHTNTKIIMAVGYQDIGIDIEDISRKRNIDKISRRYFSELENKKLSTSDNFIQDFYILWTLKESQVKRDSLGIAKGFSDAIFDKVNEKWVSNNYPNDFCTFSYDNAIISICSKDISTAKFNFFEIIDFKFIPVCKIRNL